MRQVLLAATLALGAAGCAAYSEQELLVQCPATDWYAYGLEDGRLGQPFSRAEAFFEGCNEVGVEPDIVAYRTGRRQGLERYCTAENGYEVGLELIEYHEVCPPELETAFVQGLRRGRKDSPYRDRGYPGIYPHIGIGVGSHTRVRSGLVIAF